ncbi:MAG: DNA internalization-related competence protein ComEC/Rec2 [Luminiphilus sp.]|nr:DNA internalization-related competence protein ComEC/Rec2 [Luminiphilus sp.]
MLWLDSRLPDACFGRTVNVTGRVTTLPKREWTDRGHWRVSASLKVHQIDSPECRGPDRLVIRQYLETNELEQALAYGRVISGAVRLKPLPSQLNPGVLPDQARSVSRSLDAVATVVGPLVMIADRGPVSKYRTRFLNDWSTQAGQGWLVMRALLFGDTRGIDQALWQDLRYLGIVHVLVISGLHIALLGSLIHLITQLPRRFFRVSGDRGVSRISALTVISVTGLYVLLTGASLPTQRAYLMLLATQIPSLCGWAASPRRSLLLALLVLAMWDPMVLLGSSFWLSASATWLLVSHSNLSGDPLSLLRTQFLLVVLMAPLSLFWFGEASWLGIPVNLLAVPVVTLFMVPMGLVGVATADLAPAMSELTLMLSAAAWERLMVPLQMLLDCCQPIAIVVVPLDGIGLMFGLAAIMCWHVARMYSLASLCLIVVLQMLPRAPAHVISMTVLDVGQGLSLVAEAAGRVLLYDTGDGVPGRFTQAEKTVLPHLLSRGIKKLDMLVISHADRDHSGGARAIRERLPVDRHIGFGGEGCRNGERWRWGELEILVLNGPGSAQEDANDQSCGLLLVAGSHRILVMGDISSRRERHWVRYWRETLSATVLVVAHHGSRSSSSHTLLKWVRPGWSVISAGRANRFGHPHPEVLSRLSSAWRSSVLTTAERGAITIRLSPEHRAGVLTQRDEWSPYWLKLP